jgi:hypothetical protein
MSFLNKKVYDYGLKTITNKANALVICSEKPLSYNEALNDYFLGDFGISSSTPIEISDPEYVSGNEGRKVIINTIPNGQISKSGIAKHWALINTEFNMLIATEKLNNEIEVEQGNSFLLSSFEIGFLE